jgi:hypothetical protein
LTTHKSNGEKNHHCITQSKNIGDKAKKVEMTPTFRQPQNQESRPMPNQELTTHLQNKIPRPKQVFPNPKHKQIHNKI